MGLGEFGGEAEPRGHGEGGRFLTRAQCRRAGGRRSCLGCAPIPRGDGGAECHTCCALRCPREVQAGRRVPSACPPGPPRPFAALELSLSRILLPSLCGSSISQGLFWKSWRRNDFFFNLLLFLILKLCFVFKKSRIRSRYEELRKSRQCSIDGWFGQFSENSRAVCGTFAFMSLFSKPPL